MRCKVRKSCGGSMIRLSCVMQGNFLLLGVAKMKNIKEAMSVADESISENKQKKDTKKIEVSKKKFYYWLLGIVLSMLPLLALPLKDWITGENVYMVVYELFCDVSIVFVGISFTITSLNDYISQHTHEDKAAWVKLNILFLLLGTILYVVMLIQKNENSEVEMKKIFEINIIYFVIMLILSANNYIKEIWRAKKNGSD